MASLKFSISQGALTVVSSGGSFTVDATSGRGAYMNRPEAMHRKDEGPIPIGRYHIQASDLSDPPWWKDIGRTVWHRADWGDWRVVLYPAPGTKTLGRSDFFLHGGIFAGSRGCIDIGGGLFGDGETDRVKAAIMEDSDGLIPLEVVR